MVAGHLREKNGIWQMILELKDSSGNRKTKSISTGLPIKGNKKKAEEMLLETRRKYENPSKINKSDANLYFHEYMEKWLTSIKGTVVESTYSSYESYINRRIVPYFKEKDIRLCDLKADDIQAFFRYAQVAYHASNKTINRYHSNIRSALKKAFKAGLVDVNEADKVDKLKETKFIANFYSESKLKELLLLAKKKNDPLLLPIALAGCYGLRRQEVIGLKWSAIDFKSNIFTIKHTVTKCYENSKTVYIARDSVKSKPSYRTFPLVEPVKSMLLDTYKTQQFTKQLSKESYCNDFKDYVCVNELGILLTPNFVTTHFPVLLKNCGLERIRFHDLRHSCASILHANGVSMKDISDWLGHSSIKITMDLYTHLTYTTKIQSALVMEKIMLS